MKRVAFVALVLTAAIGSLAHGQGQQIQVVGGGAPSSATPATPQPASFEVASVKRNVSGDPGMRIGIQPGGRFTTVGTPARQLLLFAYQVQDFQLVDVPDWARDERYDITAKAEGDIPPTPLGSVGPLQMMVRSLLAERFKLVARQDTREMPIYALVLTRPGQLGPQLKESTTDCAAVMAAARARGAGPGPLANGDRPLCGMRGAPGQLQGGSMRLGELARFLSNQVQRVVVDKTGLAGNFDFNLTYTPERLPQGAPPPGAPPAPPIDPNGPSVFTAIQEQLGLKLEAQRGPVDVLVVEKMERPAED